MVLKIIGITAVMVVVFIAFRRWGFQRGSRRLEASLREELAPLLGRLERGEALEEGELRAAAEPLATRRQLYTELEARGARERFPGELTTPAEVSRALLAEHLAHPAEMQESPVEVEAVDVVRRRVGREEADFHLLHFRMREGHWTGRGPWLGIAGPFREGDAPFAATQAACARAGDRPDEIQHDELVDWLMTTQGA